MKRNLTKTVREHTQDIVERLPLSFCIIDYAGLYEEIREYQHELSNYEDTDFSIMMSEAIPRIMEIVYSHIIFKENEDYRELGH